MKQSKAKVLLRYLAFKIRNVTKIEIVASAVLGLCIAFSVGHSLGLTEGVRIADETLTAYTKSGCFYVDSVNGLFVPTGCR